MNPKRILPRWLALLAAFCAGPTWIPAAPSIDLRVVAELDLGQPIEQFRAVPVRLGPNRPLAVCALYGSDAEIDPYRKMFFFPRSTLKLVLFDEDGTRLWTRDLGAALVPGVWFAPVFAFDMDGDGADEIYLVNNTDLEHPLDNDTHVLERLDARTGAATGRWPFPQPAPEQQLSKLFRHFIFAGYDHGVPVLVAANGTYGPMRLRAYHPDMSVRWEKTLLPASDRLAAGSHMCAIVDLDGDGRDEVMWGERAIRLGDGHQHFSADGTAWNDHSDIVQPVRNRHTGTWSLWTCREGAPAVSPRLAFFDAQGRRLWGDVDRGHMDTGWAAHLRRDEEPTVFAIRMKGKQRSAEGEKRTGVEEFAYRAFSGKRVELGFGLYTTIPVDLDGDGYHELVRGYFEGDGAVLDAAGREVGRTHGHAAIVSKFTRHPGEQILTYAREGRVRLYRDINALDTPEALARYRHRFYLPNQKLTGVGYNYFNLGGL
jgi:hypothetical protein